MNIRLFALALLGSALLSAQSSDSTKHPKHGVITGIVVEQKTGNPVKKATVIAQPDQQRGLGAATDSAGKFTLRDLDPGTYLLTVERDGYVPARDSERKVIVVGAGETKSDVNLTMLRTGVISGRVIDSDGDPVTGASVQVAPLQKKKDAAPGYFAGTNDLGEYRVFNVAPGDYRVVASYEARPRQREIQMQKQLNADGRAPNDTYQPTYYQGTAHVETGTELHGVDVQMIRAHAVKIRGRITGLSGVLGIVMLQPVGGSGTGLRNALVQNIDGGFELADVLPGKYLLTAMGGQLNGATKLTGRRTLEVGDTDLEDVNIPVGQGRKLPGRFIIPEGRKLPAGLIVVLGSSIPGDTQGGGFAQVEPDGTFSMTEVAPGDYDLIVHSSGPSDDLYIGAIRLGDADAMSDGLHIDGPPATLEIVLKPNGGTAECSVKDDKGSAAPAAHVLLIPDPPRKRQAALYGDCDTNATGTCRINGITPGDYHAYAFSGDKVDFRDPDALKPFESNAKAVGFVEGQVQQVELQLPAVE